MTTSVANGKAGWARRQNARAWSTAVVMAIGWHAVWWVWLQGVEVRARTRLPGVPVVRYQPVGIENLAETSATTDRRPLWSPTLFSLPTEVGFSRMVLKNVIGVRPPLAMPVVDTRFLPREPRPFREPIFSYAIPSMQDSVSDVLTAFPLRTSHEPVFVKPVLTGLVVRTELLGGLSGGHVQDAVLPEWPPALKERSWEAVAFVETDDEGRIRHVFLERRSPAEPFNLELIRLMRAWRIEEIAHPASGRIVIRSYAPATAAVAREGRAP